MFHRFHAFCPNLLIASNSLNFVFPTTLNYWVDPLLFYLQSCVHDIDNSCLLWTLRILWNEICIDGWIYECIDGWMRQQFNHLIDMGTRVGHEYIQMYSSTSTSTFKCTRVRVRVHLRIFFVKKLRPPPLSR